MLVLLRVFCYLPPPPGPPAVAATSYQRALPALRCIVNGDGLICHLGGGVIRVVLSTGQASILKACAKKPVVHLARS